MRIYQPSYKDRATGQRRKTPTWWIELKDHNNALMVLPGFKDKNQTRRLANQIEALIALS
ncbi:MAG: hypothetical protein GC164_16160 [Phycisphaera sp.]|nr:hypothetical protein [Phycisphaera sp.]